MIEWTPTLSVIVGALGLSVVTILGSFTFALLMGRSLQWKTQNLSSLWHQFHEVSEQRGDKLVLWQRRGCLFSILWILPAILLIATGNWIFLPVVIAVIVLMLPLGMILNGLTAIETQFLWNQSPFRPIGLITGEQAIRRGRWLIIVGIALLLPCVLCILSFVGHLI